MGARGPKPGFKKAREAAAAQAVEVSAPSLLPTTHADRENPDKVSGADLKELAHRRGIAKSLLASMTDDKIRTELRYITHRQYDDAVA